MMERESIVQSRKWLEGYRCGMEDERFSQQAAALPQSGVWQEVTVDARGAGHTYRLPVPGGWLYRTVTYRFPEMHAMWDEYREMAGRNADKYLRSNESWTTSCLNKSMEIVAQNTVFVPE